MDDHNPASTFTITTLTHVIASICSLQWARYAGLLARITFFPVRMLCTPLPYLWGFLQAVFAPAGYVLSFLAGWLASIASFLIGLQPLYTFFGVAAFIGVIAGIIMAIASAIMTASLELNDDDQHRHTSQLAYQKNSSLGNRHLKEQYLKDQYLSTGDKAQSLGLEPDWHWTDPSSSFISNSARLRISSSLQAQTIHEEEDDDSQH